ncbi:tetratricopeptide repeat protein [Daejeonella sp.]|uniref:tetratricopeptide repeat protein n=1 Tax=Daejeonella sp. TaxID=2805397 RepID=UPI003983CC9B
MKKIILLFLINFFFLTTVDAQTQVKDSLKLLLQKEKTDTGRVLLLADLGFEYMGSKQDTIMVLALEGLSLSRRIGFIKGEAVSLNRIGNAFNGFGNYPKAMESFLKALKINEKIKNTDGIQRNLNNIGVVHLSQEDYQRALAYLFKSKELAEKNNNKRSISISLGYIGLAYLNLKKIDSARLYTQQAHDVAYEIHFPRIIGSSLTTLGGIHSQTGQNKLALEYYRLSAPYSERAENFADLSNTYLGMAKLFKKIDRMILVLFMQKNLF